MSTSESIQLKRVISWDIVILVALYFVPTVSHYLGFPLYLLDPMRFAVLGSLLFLNNKCNAYLLAATLPVFSYFIGGHPVFVKSALISLELISNVALLFYFRNRIKNIFVTTLLSIVLSKSLYYFIKYLVIVSGLLSMNLIATPLWIQAIVAVVLSISFAVIYNKKLL